MVSTGKEEIAAATDVSKLLITLAAGIVAFATAVVNVSTADRTLLTPDSVAQKALLFGSLTISLLSIGSGVVTHLAITHELASGKTPDVWNIRVRMPLKTQIVTLLLAILATIAYGVVRLLAI